LPNALIKIKPASKTVEVHSLFHNMLQTRVDDVGIAKTKSDFT
jgi:hypothetical protein